MGYNEQIRPIDSSLCPVHDVHHMRLAKEHELGVGKDLSSKVVFVLANPLRNVQKDQEITMRKILRYGRTI